MIKRAIFLLFGTVLSLATIGQPLSADIVSPGDYSGYFFVDRWGQAVLNRGTSYTFVSDAIVAKLRKYEGKPIKLKVTKILQPMNPGAGMITEAEEPTRPTSPLENLQVKLEAKKTKVVHGRGIEIAISIKNPSKETISVWPGAMEVHLVTNRPFNNSEIGYKDPEDTAYWCHEYTFLNVASGRRLNVACRADRVPWSAEDMAAHGKNLTVKRDWDRYGGNVLVFGPGAEFTNTLIVGKEFLPREYEAFLYLRLDEDKDYPGLMSNRIAFDVVEKK